MTLEERVLFSQKDQSIANDLISDYKNFISSCAQKTLGRYVTDQDDEMSIAMLAFHEAIQKYEMQKGSFLNFAHIIIKNRIIDYIRKEHKNTNSIPFSNLEKVDDDGNTIEFDIEAPINNSFDIKHELEVLSIELRQFDITYFELTKVTPKSKKTKLACQKVIEFILNHPIMISELKTKKYLPIKLIMETVSIDRKIIERHRKYIIAVVIILSGQYDLIAEYFPMKGGHR